MRSLPYTLLGCLLGLGSLGRPRLAHGLLLFQSRRGFAWLFLARRGFVAVTFGRVVITTDPALPLPTLMHEQHHACQYERLGLLFLPVYLYWHLRAGYAANPLEQAAARCAEQWAAEHAAGSGQE
ncbi:MAG: hypothetical protein HY690_12460 [Chloroflexi bacterium]|nr:hypothetical protein [Chloroflexota bacterium]